MSDSAQQSPYRMLRDMHPGPLAGTDQPGQTVGPRAAKYDRANVSEDRIRRFDLKQDAAS
jgi:hypothetical protein